jgi:hypothetical protein
LTVISKEQASEQGPALEGHNTTQAFFPQETNTKANCMSVQ